MMMKDMRNWKVFYVKQYGWDWYFMCWEGWTCRIMGIFWWEVKRVFDCNIKMFLCFFLLAILFLCNYNNLGKFIFKFGLFYICWLSSFGLYFDFFWLLLKLLLVCLVKLIKGIILLSSILFYFFHKPDSKGNMLNHSLTNWLL